MLSLHDEVLNSILNRKSIRKFTDQPVTKERIEKIVRAGQSAPTGSGQQAYSFILISDNEKKRQIIQAIGSQQFMDEAPIWLVICIDWMRFHMFCDAVELDIEISKVTRLYRGIMDTMLAAENMVIAAEAMGLGTVFNGGVGLQAKKLVEILKLPEKVFPVIMLCIGYPIETHAQRPRWPIDVVLHENEYKMPSKQSIKNYNDRLLQEHGRASTWVNSWKRRFSKSLAEKTETELKDQLKELKFI